MVFFPFTCPHLKHTPLLPFPLFFPLSFSLVLQLGKLRIWPSAVQVCTATEDTSELTGEWHSSALSVFLGHLCVALRQIFPRSRHRWDSPCALQRPFDGLLLCNLTVLVSPAFPSGVIIPHSSPLPTAFPNHCQVFLKHFYATLHILNPANTNGMWHPLQ